MNDKQMIDVYRHDAHKLRGQSHKNATDEIFGIPANTDVPYNADGNAALLSRPHGKPEQTLHGHETHYRRLLSTGNTRYDPQSFSLQQYRSDIESLLSCSDAEQMHEQWLDSQLVKWFNESVYQPYTSLKYHTLLVAALVANYREGREFDELGLFMQAGDSKYMQPHKTIFRYGGSRIVQPFQIYIDEHDPPHSTKLSTAPRRNFASVWGRLPTHPWRRGTVENTQRMEVIDSNLRRIKSWSTGLQYLENSLGETNA